MDEYKIEKRVDDSATEFHWAVNDLLNNRDSVRIDLTCSYPIPGIDLTMPVGLGTANSGH